MKIIKETEHCIVRFLHPEDFELFRLGFEHSLASKNRFDDGYINTTFMDKDWYDKLLKRREEEVSADRCYVFNIFNKNTGESIGYCDITTMIRMAIQCAKIGYTILNQYWGNGFGTEVVSAISEIGFDELNFHRLEAHVNLDNNASKAVLSKAGYKYEGIRERYILEDNKWTDNEIYCLIKQ